MSIYVSLLTAGTNNHEETSENVNAIATDFVSEGVIGAITNTSGVAPATGAFAVNAQDTPDMTAEVSSGVAYVQGTPTGQDSQMLRVRMSADTSVTVSDNSSGSTKYDWVYIKLDADKMANPGVDADDVATLVTSRSSSSTSDDGTPPTYGYPIAVITVADSASSITNANISDKRVLAASTQDNSVTPSQRTGGYAVGSFSVPAATGNFSVSGIGFKPQKVRFQVLFGASTSQAYSAGGVMTSSGQGSWAMTAGSSAAARNSSTTDCIMQVNSGSSTPTILAHYVSMDDDGFTVNFSAVAFGTVLYEAEG